MYTTLFSKKQFDLIGFLLRKQQLRFLTASLKTSANTISNYSKRNYTLTKKEQQQWIRSDMGTQLNIRCIGGTNQLLEKQNKDQVDLESEEVEDVNDFEDMESLTRHYNLKQTLYIDEDNIMKKLNSTENINEVKSVLETEKSHLDKKHIVQSIILVWMFNKLHRSINKIDEKITLDYILLLLEEKVPQLNMNELSTCYLYLRKMGIENSDPVLQQILINALDEVEKTQEIIEMPALARLVVGLNTGKDFFMPMMCAKFLRHLRHHIDMCTNGEDVNMISICLSNLQEIISNEMINLFKQKISELIDLGQISSDTPKIVIKILSLLNIPVWSHQHIPLIRKLMLTLEPCLTDLHENDLKNLCRIYQYHMEPALLQQPLAEAMGKVISNKMTPESLACYIPFAQPHRRDTLINAFKALISSPESWHMRYATSNFFSILRGLKISDTKICDAYWNHVLTELQQIPEEETHLRFLRHCHRYMNFNNNLGGTYRHVELEKLLSRMCMQAIEHDLAGRIPEKFSRLCSFVLAYGHTPYSWKKYPNILLSKIITMGQQFSPADCYLISRGLQISLEMRYRFQTPQLIGMQLSTIDSVLTTCIEKHLNDEELTLTDLNLLVRTLGNRKSLKNSVIYHKTLQKYKDIKCEDLNSRIIRDITYNFMATNYLIPEILDQMFTYIEKNQKYVSGDIVEKVLNCSYNLGYTPQSFESLHCTGDILLRDFNYMSGLSLVQACLALCFYKTIPEELINKVFCVKFIQRVEEEIHKCYSKATYPKRVLNIVMQLNRSICLDFPEANVPWFQQNFIEAQMSKNPSSETEFSEDVKSLLAALLKNESYIRCNHTTPYGYQIDFVLNFDKNKNPVEAPVETTMLDRITKVAILLLKLDSFCENDLKALKGPESMKIKHLEMMGYKVLHINEHDWNSKYMNVPGAKRNYLKCLLQISS